MKSQLKIIEAGFHKKAIIAQDFGPYQIDMKNAYKKAANKNELPIFDETANGYLVESSKNHKQWHGYLKKLISNPEQIEILSNNLHKTITETYSLKKISEDRRNFYKSLVNK